MAEPPPGYRQVSIQQLVRADREMFRIMCDKARTGIKVTAAGLRPCDKACEDALVSAKVTMLLLPLQGGPSSSHQSGGSSASVSGTPKDSKAAAKRKRKLEATAANSAKQPPKKAPRGKEDGQRMPAGLVGKANKDTEGRFICFACNLPGGCSKAKLGERCAKGWHLCCEPGCFSNKHTLQNHGK